MLTDVPVKLGLLTLPSPGVCKARLQTSKSTPMEAKFWSMILNRPLTADTSIHSANGQNIFVSQDGPGFETVNHAADFFLDPNDAQAMTG